MAASVDEGAAEFRLRPSIDKKFSKEIAQEIIHAVLSEELKNQVFEGNEQITTLCQTLSTKIKDKMKNMDTGDSDYKLVCYTIIGEQRGAGIRVAARCVWDSATDVVASVSYENESLFCVATVYAVHFY